MIDKSIFDSVDVSFDTHPILNLESLKLFLCAEIERVGKNPGFGLGGDHLKDLGMDVGIIDIKSSLWVSVTININRNFFDYFNDYKFRYIFEYNERTIIFRYYNQKKKRMFNFCFNNGFITGGYEPTDESKCLTCAAFSFESLKNYCLQ
jgi:hypothetical protein